MTLADLALVVAFWLLLSYLRLLLRVNPRYRGKRRVGRQEPSPIEPSPGMFDAPVWAEPYMFRVPPYVPYVPDVPEVVEPDLDVTGPMPRSAMFGTEYRSNGRYRDPERTP